MDASSPATTSSLPVRRHRGWLLAFASLLIVLGLIAINAPLVGVAALVQLLGWLLMLGGALQIVGALLLRPIGATTGALMLGALGIVLGAVTLWAPLMVGSLLALVVVLGLIADALLGGWWAAATRQRGWIWPVLIALLGVALGIAIVMNPRLLPTLLGLIVGINLVVRGVVLLLVALAAPAPQHDV